MSICLAITDVDWKLTKDVASVLGSAGALLGVAAAAYFGHQGLATWKNQIKGVGDHELARRTLIELYRYRDAVAHVRSPAIWANETEPNDNEPTHVDPEIETFNQKNRAYTRRLREVHNIRAPLSAALLESEAVWGVELKNLLNTLFGLEHELMMYIRAFLIVQNPQCEDDYKASYKEILRKMRDILYSDSNDDVDFFRAEFSTGISVIEKYLKGKLVS